MLGKIFITLKELPHIKIDIMTINVSPLTNKHKEGKHSCLP